MPKKKTTKRAVRKPFIDLLKVEREAYIKDLEKDLDKSDIKFTTKRVVKDVKKDIERLNKINKGIREASHKLLALYPAKEYLEKQEGIEIPHLRGGDWKWNFEKKPMSLQDKITWVLTAVNVAILISLVIKNV